MNAVAAAVPHAAAALVLAVDLTLIGFAAMPARIRPRRSRHALPVALSIGALLVSGLVFLTGTFLGTRVVPIVVGAATLLALLRARSWWAMVRRAVRQLAALARANVVATLATAALAAVLLPQLLLPVVDSDGLRYHLALPKLFLMTGHVFYYPYDTSGALPQSAEMLYMLLLPAGAESAKFLHAIFFLATLPVLAMIAAQHPRARRLAMFAPLFYAAAPVVLAPAGATFIDHFAAFHVAVAALLIFRDESSVLCGLALGAAMGTKVTVAPAVAGLALCALFRRPRQLLPLVTSFLIAVSPYATRALVHTGDPIYPLGYTLLRRQPPGVDPGRQKWAAEFHSAAGGPLHIAWMPQPDVEPDEVAGLHHVFGLFAIVLAIRDRRARRWLWLLVPSLLAAWVYHPSTRLFLPLFAGLALFETLAIAHLPRRWAVPVALAVVLPAALIAGHEELHLFEPWDYLAGRVTRDQFLAANRKTYRVSQFVNAQPPGGTVMALDFPTPFFFDRPFINEGLLNQPPLAAWVAEARTPDDVMRRLHEHDVRLLVVTPGYASGSKYSLIPLATDAHQAAIIAGVRLRLRRLATVDGVDVFAVP